MNSDTPPVYAGPAQHTYTRACDGFHQPGPCPDPDPAKVTVELTWTPDA